MWPGTHHSSWKGRKRELHPLALGSGRWDWTRLDTSPPQDHHTQVCTGSSAFLLFFSLWGVPLSFTDLLSRSRKWSTEEAFQRRVSWSNGYIEGPKSWPHVDSSSLKLESLSAKKWCGTLGKGLMEEGRSQSSSKGCLPSVSEQSSMFMSTDTSSKYTSIQCPTPDPGQSSESPKGHLLAHHCRPDLFHSHLLEPLKSWALNRNRK
jgi:hypothetical protein